MIFDSPETFLQFVIVISGCYILYTSKRYERQVSLVADACLLMNAFWLAGKYMMAPTDTIYPVATLSGDLLLIGDWVMLISMISFNFYHIYKGSKIKLFLTKKINTKGTLWRK